MSAFTGRLGGFTLSVAVNALASLLTIPFIIRFAGEGQWAAIAVGQSLGSILSVFSLLGWSLTGPSDVARANGLQRGSIYLESIHIRTGAAAILIMLALIVSQFIGSLNPTATWLASCSMITQGVGATWFYVGEGRPLRLLLFDTLPRALGVGAATICVGLTASAVLYSLIVFITTTVAVVLTSIDILNRYLRGQKASVEFSVTGVLSRQRHAIATGALTATYQSAPILIVQLLAPQIVPLFALLDKLRMQALTAYRPIAQAFQGWVPAAISIQNVEQRARVVIRVSSVLALAGGILTALLLPYLVSILSVGRLEVTPLESIPTAVVVAGAVVSATVGPACLVPLGFQVAVMRSALAGTVLTLATLPVLINFGLVGAISALAIGQTSVVIVQLSAVHTRPREAD